MKGWVKSQADKGCAKKKAEPILALPVLKHA